MQSSGLDFSGQQTADKFVGFQSGGQHGKRRVEVAGRFGNIVENQLEQRAQIFLFVGHFLNGPAIAPGSIENREVKLLIVGVQADKKVENFIKNFINPGVGFIGFVNDNNRAQAEFDGFAEHEFCLRHRAFGRVNQQDDTIHHGENAFDFAAEVGVARCVNDVNVGAVPVDGGAFGQDGNAAFAFQIIAVHNAFGNFLIVAESSALS